MFIRPQRAAIAWLGAALLAWTALATRASDAAGGAVRPPTPIELAAGVYMLPGSGGEPDTANLGRVGNAG